MPLSALGMIETKSIIGAVTAANAILKSACVNVKGKDESSEGVFTIFFEGEIGAVKIALGNASDAAIKTDEFLNRHVIPNPHLQLKTILEK